jgi:lipid-binding SYLF domain-containing protein
MRTHRIVGVLALVLAAGMGANHARAAEDTPKLIHEANTTLAAFKATDPALSSFFDRAAGYAIFPSISKVAVGVGGARGSGVLFDKHGHPVGKATLSQLSVGVQLGGQSYAEIIFFETPQKLAEFKAGSFALSAEASAVALKTGSSANARFQNGIAVFTATKQGLMFEAAVGGQKFEFEPFASTK